jgi:biotin carboxyl carrier protein
MKKFDFTIRGNKYQVEILDIEDNIAEVEVNGTSYQVEIHKEIKSSKTPKLVRKAANQSLESDKAKTNKPSESASLDAIKAPLPGTILEIKVREGDQVKEGDLLLVMEAMKMENDIKADRSGTIKSIKVHPESSVLEGDVLLEIGG